jgi:hypothetical protein
VRDRPEWSGGALLFTFVPQIVLWLPETMSG